MRFHGAVLAVLLAVLPAAAAAVETLPVKARIGPWPTLSKPVAYDGRLWLVNSVLGINHNSADLYSFDPTTGATRYERHLFSQDAGDPLVAGGLLYWPFEDSRSSVGWGELAATDGENWTAHAVPTGQIFHIHAMAEFQGRLIAASSAWKAGLHESADGGATWTRVYEHPTPKNRVSRIVALAATADLLFAHIIDGGKSRLLRYDGAAVEDVPGWPAGRPIRDLAVRGGHVFGLVAEAAGAAIWSSDGNSSRRIHGPAADWSARALAADDDALWVATRAGKIWRSADGRTWAEAARVEEGKPIDLWVRGGDIYVLGSGDDGLGILWGPARPAPIPRLTARPPLPRRPPTAWIQEPYWPAEGKLLAALIADPETYEERSVLRDRVWQNVETGATGIAFEIALEAEGPDLSIPLIGGNATASATTLARWTVLWGMAAAGHGRVSPKLLSLPFASPANRAEKYFDLAPAAMWAATRIGQDDRRTIDALIGRLDRDDDPDWLQGDVIGALTALTGKRFGYDTAAWRAWWRATDGDK